MFSFDVLETYLLGTFNMRSQQLDKLRAIVCIENKCKPKSGL